MWDGVMQVKVEGKGDKVRYVEVDPGTQRRLQAYFAVTEHRDIETISTSRCFARSPAGAHPR